MPFYEIANDLIGRGYSVIPIEPRGKAPVKGWGAKSATQSDSIITGWANTYPDANVGIVADSRIVILESDDWERLEATLQLGLGRTVMDLRNTTAVAYGSSPNRPHLFFKRTTKATNVGNCAVPGLFECRFSNQYVVGPGSVHPSGAVYRWENNLEPIALPDWLIGELARLALQNKRDTDLKTIERKNGRVIEGSRHYFLMSELGKAWDGEKSEEEMYEFADDLNLRFCEPPKTVAHVRQCVRDIMRREPYNPGPDVLIGSAEKKTSEPTEEWQALSATELLALEIPPRAVVMAEGESVLFYERSINQILAWRGVGKTNFALGLASAIASGGRILEFAATRPRKVLYIDGELPLAQLQERVRGFIDPGHRGNLWLFSPEMLTPSRALNLVNNGDYDSLMQLIKRHEIEVIFIDSQATTMSGDSNEDVFQENRMVMLRQLRWAGLCVIEMHHVGKMGLQRGLSKNDDILDVQLHLKKSPDWEPEDGLEFELVYEKVRHAAALNSGYLVKLQDGEWVKQFTNEMHEVVRLTNDGQTVREIARELHINKNKVHRLQQKARKSGLLPAAVEVHIGE